MMYRRCLILLSGLWIFLFCLAGLSQANEEVTQALVHRSEKLIREGRAQDAVLELARALLIDMDNTAARTDFLGLQGASGLSDEVRARIQDYRQLWDILQRQQSQIDGLLQERAGFVHDLLEAGIPQSRISKRLSYWEEHSFKKQSEAQKQWEEQAETEKDPLVLLNASMRLEKIKKFNKLAYLERQKDDLQNLKYALAVEGTGKNAGKVSRVYTQEFYNFKGEPKYTTATRPLLRVQDFEGLKSVLNALYERNISLEEHLARQSAKMDRLSKQIVNLSLRVSEQDMQKEKAEQAAVPAAEAQEWQARFQLSERIIKQKDERIQALEQSVAGYKGLLAKKESDYKDQLKEKESTLNTLGQEIFALNVKLDHMRRKRLLLTRKEMKKIAGKRMNRLKTEVALKNDKVTELEGVLQLYKDLLADSSKTSKAKDTLIQQKDETISGLRKDMGRLHEEIAQKENLTNQYYENLRGLQSQVLLMHQQLLSLQKGNVNPFMSPTLDKRVQDMEAQLNGIGTFIQQELQKHATPNLN